ncbi:solute carrier family 25 member 46-like [Stegodyphus dumicola]|uniref:solute carrier family 25 member 46-like n=1 Tax=Stegodyphus dumicola TaxID=202533 RepID=UPI0015ABA209|nr:solute carrier family 25 member 46-like [Stegodyphus dumicola]
MSSRVELLPIDEEGRSRLSKPNLYGSQGLLMTDSNVPHPQPDYIPENLDTDHAQKFAGIGLEIASTVIGSLISHPCIVLRRQCQVNRKAARYHLSPFTLVPVVIRLQSRQGLKCLWKGCSGIFILRGCSVALETFIAELTPFPREVSSNNSLKQLAQHLLLKLITYGFLTPFYCASLVETVQSDIASEKPGVLDCIKEGFCRLFRVGTPHSTRLLPMWQLVGPTALYGVSFYVLSSLVRSVFQWFHSMKLLNQHKQNSQANQSSAVNYLDNLSTVHFGSLVASIMLYPGETLLHRLYLQGTRTIIDNLDSGTSVLPVITKYEGVVDCFHTIVAEEGAAGLYKGFGALLLEYAFQALILKIARITLNEIEQLFRASAGKKT